MRLRGEQVDLGLRLLDHQLIDSEGMRCGKIDDVLFAENERGGLQVAALLTGPQAQRRRMPRWMRELSRWFGSASEHRVEWSHVAKIEARVELDQPAEELGLGGGDRAMERYVDWMPRS